MTVDITQDLVAALLREQHPDLAHLPLALGAVGWDNQLWRLGDDLAVRLPWQTDDADELLLKEYGLVPALASRLPLPIPTPMRLGRPSERFGRTWIVTTWVEGEPADRAPVTPGAGGETALAAFLSALHRPAPPDAPIGRHGRGGSLAATSQGVAHFLRLAVERGLIHDARTLETIWGDAASAPDWSGPPIWIHADLHPANVLTRDGALCGVIDFGDLCAGDPACDLAAAWLLLPDGATDSFYRACEPGPDEATRRRARGWALSKALVCLIIGDDGTHGRPGGKPSWGQPAAAALKRLAAL
ncbi:aminoglycoside phosphotransferase family protein [Devosia sediminis]|uniref:Aminoglycoside phosphotransferase family protein n=1 Tax=Devosia sediminis TaxID=2798801 RepID=A0A934IYT7_9HYPH|nr:aminoglycoside phosphotransferase family protein [Devosia sediminis]MBJ3784715.1 aminoglycoside phosphotransferase family protein [Devosia sediminis]